MPTDSSELTSLPAPGDAELSRSRELVAMIRDEIEAAGGVIGFDQYMNRALYTPGYGYYSAGCPQARCGGRLCHGSGNITTVFAMCGEPGG